MINPEDRAELLDMTLQSLAGNLDTLRELMESGTEVKDVFPLWTNSRELETELSNIRNEAGWKLNAIQARDMETH